MNPLQASPSFGPKADNEKKFVSFKCCFPSIHFHVLLVELDFGDSADFPLAVNKDVLILWFL